MDNNSNENFMWFPKALYEITEGITLAGAQTDIELKLNRIDAAATELVTYGIDKPTINYKEAVDELYNHPKTATPKFYTASEMSGKRTALSEKDASVMSLSQVSLVENLLFVQTIKRKSRATS